MRFVKMGNHVFVKEMHCKQKDLPELLFPRVNDEIISAGPFKGKRCSAQCILNLIQAVQIAESNMPYVTLTLERRTEDDRIRQKEQLYAELYNCMRPCAPRGTTVETFKRCWWEQEMCKTLYDYDPREEPDPGYLMLRKGHPVFVHPWSAEEAQHNNLHNCPYIYGWDPTTYTESSNWCADACNISYIFLDQGKVRCALFRFVAWQFYEIIGQ